MNEGGEGGRCKSGDGREHEGHGGSYDSSGGRFTPNPLLPAMNSAHQLMCVLVSREAMRNRVWSVPATGSVFAGTGSDLPTCGLFTNCPLISVYSCNAGAAVIEATSRITSTLRAAGA
jgi:hypothetical protein